MKTSYPISGAGLFLGLLWKKILAARGMTSADSIVLFGVTPEARLIAPFLETYRLNVSLIVDSNPDFQGTFLDGIPVDTPDCLLEGGSYFVVTASACNYLSMKGQLEGMGFKEHHQFTDYQTIMAQTFF